MKQVLVVDDDIELAHLLSIRLNRRLGKVDHVQIQIAGDPYEAMNLMAENAFDLVLLDWHLQGLTGRQTLMIASRDFDRDPNLPEEWKKKAASVVVMSASGKPQECVISGSRYFNYAGYVAKAEGLDRITNRVQECL